MIPSRKSKKLNSEKGATLAVMLLVVALLLILINVVLTRYFSELTMTNQSYRRVQAFQIAEAGLEKAKYELKKPASVYKGERNTSFADGHFTIQIQSPSANIYKVTVIGTVIPKSRYTQKVILQTTLTKRNNLWEVESWREL